MKNTRPATAQIPNCIDGLLGFCVLKNFSPPGKKEPGVVVEVAVAIVDVGIVLLVDVKTVGDDVMIDDPFTDDKLVGIE
jgi:hypothetical protein